MCLGCGPVPASPSSSFKPPCSVVTGCKHTLVPGGCRYQMRLAVTATLGCYATPPQGVRQPPIDPSMLPTPSGCAATAPGLTLPPVGLVTMVLPHSPIALPLSEPSVEDRLPTPKIRLHITINVVSHLNAVEDFQSLPIEEISLRQFLLDQILCLQESLEPSLVPHIIKEILGRVGRFPSLY
jgi:hypothetical protein